MRSTSLWSNCVQTYVNDIVGETACLIACVTLYRAMQQLHIKLGHSGCLWRQSQPRLSCFVIRAEGTSAEKSRDAVAERIAKARQYRELAKGQSQLGSSATQAQQQQPAAQVADAPEKLLAHGDSHASRQEQQLLAAVNEIRNAPERSTSSQDEAAIGKSSQSAQQPKPQAASYAKQASAQSSTQPQGVPPAPAQPAKRLSKADMLAKITQARAYKQEKQAKGGVGSPDIVQVSVTKADPAAQQQASPSSAALSQPKDSFSATQRRTASREADSSQANEPHEQQQTEHEGVGSATQAAGFLQQAVKGKDGSKGMRLETYSMLKEQEMRNQKVRSPQSVHPYPCANSPTKQMLGRCHSACDLCNAFTAVQKPDQMPQCWHGWPASAPSQGPAASS